MIRFIYNTQNRQIHRESTNWWFARGWEEGNGEQLRNGCGVSFWGMKMFGVRQRWWLHNVVSVLNSIELGNVKRLIWCYANFPSIFKKTKIKKQLQTALLKHILVLASVVTYWEFLGGHTEDWTHWVIGNAHLHLPSCYHIAVQKSYSNLHSPGAESLGSLWSLIELRTPTCPGLFQDSDSFFILL